MTTRRRLNVPGLHLMASMGVWQSGLAMAPLARLGLMPWHPRLAARGRALAGDLAKAAPDRLAAALMMEVAARFTAFARGIELYQNHPYQRPPDDRAAIQERLLGPKIVTGKPVLIVPSPVNRWHIWDLPQGEGFLSILEAGGLSPYVVDWNLEDAEFSIADHVRQRLEPALAAIAARHPGARIGLAGHCLGGTLALALAEARPKDIACLVLIGHRKSSPFADLVDVETRYRRFAEMDQASREAMEFVAVEDWANDSVALPHWARDTQTWPACPVLEIESFAGHAASVSGWLVSSIPARKSRSKRREP